MAKRVKTIKQVDLEELQSGKRAKSITMQGKIKHLKPHVLETLIYVFVILFLSVGTYWRNNIWNSEVELWTDCVKKSSNKERPHTNLGSALGLQGRHQEAIAQCTEALRINPNFVEPHYNLGIAYFMMGNRKPALKEYEILKTMNPGLANALYQIIQ